MLSDFKWWEWNARDLKWYDWNYKEQQGVQIVNQEEWLERGPYKDPRRAMWMKSWIKRT